MSQLHRWGLLVLLILASAFACYRIVAITQADRLAVVDPQRALQWIPGHAEALRRLAEQQLVSGDVAGAEHSARRLLAMEPLEGRSFRILAQAAVATGDQAKALALYRIAARRSPRDIASRAWLVEYLLVNENYAAALRHIDAILRIAPSQERVLIPLLIRLSSDPAFALALSHRLRARPAWRAAFISGLQDEADPAIADRVAAALASDGGLSEGEVDGLIDGLIARNRWHHAYALWASTPAMAGRRLAPVYNGGFESIPTGHGFDWRTGDAVPGVDVEFAPVAGAQGQAAHVQFRDRAVAAVNLVQPLLLTPGAHRLRMRARADAIASERGL
ncbi:MAG: hypothetical protein WKF61_10100, partial [Luteimonas sp.]